MEDLMESEAFCNGIAVGIRMYQQKIVTAHSREEPIKIDGESYYIQDGKDRLKELIDRACR